MCWCNPYIRAPWCGERDCKPPQVGHMWTWKVARMVCKYCGADKEQAGAMDLCPSRQRAADDG